MFVPVDLLKPILAEMQRTGSSKQSRRPWLGLTSTEQGGPRAGRARQQGQPRARRRPRAGDVVLAVDGAKVATLEAFYKKLWAHANPDDEIQLTVLQGAETDSHGQGRGPHEHDAQACRDLTASPCATVG